MRYISGTQLIGSQVEPQPLEFPLAVGPVLAYFNPEFKVDTLPDQSLEFQARSPADRLEYATAFPDNDGFVTVAFDPDQSVYQRLVLFLLPDMLDFDCQAVGDFLDRKSVV